MRIILTQAHKSWKFAVNGLVIPNGLLYIAASLEKEGHTVKLVDPLLYDWTLDQLVNNISEFSPDLVGVYLTTDSRFQGKAIIAALKNKLNVPIVGGGPHASFCAEDTLQNFQGLDYIVRGEGEEAAVQLVRKLENNERDFENIPNFSYKSGDKIIHNEKLHIFKDLDDIPLPAYHLLDFAAYKYFLPVPNKGLKKSIAVFSTRGCPQGCIFCASTHLWQKKSDPYLFQDFLNK